MTAIRSFALPAAIILASGACSPAAPDGAATPAPQPTVTETVTASSEMGTASPVATPGGPAPAVTPRMTTVPARFRGLYALDQKACAADYTYQQAFQNVTVKADSVNFFETGGPVTDVNVNGDSIAITLRETVGDNVATRAIYLALNPDGTARYRADRTAMVRKYVRCQG